MDGVAVPGKLKLKKGGVNKKKKKDAVKRVEKKDIEEILHSTHEAAEEEPSSLSTETLKAPAKTEAELKFHRRQAELQGDRILQKAQKSHREKVEQFNAKMNELTEFNDIPKVSWTK